MSERFNDDRATQPGPAGRIAYVTEAQAAQLEAALADPWSLQRHESCDGALMLVVLHRDDLATFVVDTTAGGLRLAALRDDTLVSCGRFDSMAELIIAWRGLADAETAGFSRTH